MKQGVGEEKHPSPVLTIQVQHPPTTSENDAFAALRIYAQPDNRCNLSPRYIMELLEEGYFLHAPDNNFLVVALSESVRIDDGTIQDSIPPLASREPSRLNANALMLSACPESL